VLRVIQVSQHYLAPGRVGKRLYMAATGQLQHLGRWRSLVQAQTIGKRHDGIIQTVEDQHRRVAHVRHRVKRTVGIRYQPGQRHLQRPGQPGGAQGKLPHFAVTGRHAIEHQGRDALPLLRVLTQIMNTHRAAQALPQHNQRQSLGLRLMLQPVKSGIDVLVHLRQPRRPLGQAITAIVEHQHLIALLRQPGRGAQVVSQVAAIAVQMKHRALEWHAFFGRQPPTVQAGAIGGCQGNITVVQAGGRRGDRLAGLGVEQQGAASAEGQQQAECSQGFHQNDSPERVSVGAGLLAMTSARFK